MNLPEIQGALRERGQEAWLFYDHHHRDPIAYRILGLSETMMVTRRWFYLVPAQGDPVKLVHRIESHHLDSLPGSRLEYSAWEELWQNLEAMLKPYRSIVMQYSPNNQIPYISLVDGGTLELIHSFGVEVLSSADLVARFEATLTPAQIASHFAARDAMDRIMEACFRWMGERLRAQGTDELAVQQWLGQAFEREALTTTDWPIVAVNANSGNPHYSPASGQSKPIRRGDFVLIDMWGKKKQPDAVYYDITWTGFAGPAPSERIQEIFRLVLRARDLGIGMVRQAAASGNRLRGWEVDAAVRGMIEQAGYGRNFLHRTGHSITTAVHGNGANLDNLEARDERELLPNTLFSIEPGIYLPEFGIRSEIDMLVENGAAEVTGRVQKEIVLI